MGSGTALCNALSERSLMTRVTQCAGWLGIAVATVALLYVVFGAMAQANSLPAAQMQAATPTPTPTPTPTSAVATVEEVLAKGLRLAEASPVHLAVRGTGVSNSTRCDWRGIARTPAQREAAVRFWLGLSATDTLPSASFLETLFTVTLDTLKPAYKETATSNFLAIARGGLNTEYLFLTCYVDYTASEYILGAGPTTLTLAYDRRGEAHSYALYKKEHAAGQFGSDALLSESAYQAKLDQIVWDAEKALRELMEGRQSVVFLAPMGAHNAIAIEAWQVVAQWDVQTVEGVVNAVRFGLNACIFRDVFGCAITGGNTQDILLNYDKFTSDALAIPGGAGSDPDPSDRGDAPFNKCANDSDNAYITVVHEAGHVIGIGGATDRDSNDPRERYHNGHPNYNLRDSIVNSRDVAGCTPNPFDIMAIFAIYQAK